ncbi:hypothetical protein PMAYCL1PPCAC_01227 [Pristionchus mayeri]|uniref:Uncharacterized protein n=1 Tax=Pristionchus mayeri TaxID=1317129 RepID=A0AAN4Z454_9BILA|nr:hypothetical protein PMAYCL1PPCAC_01227 [Pristionchus mayeri]
MPSLYRDGQLTVVENLLSIVNPALSCHTLRISRHSNPFARAERPQASTPSSGGMAALARTEGDHNFVDLRRVALVGRRARLCEEHFRARVTGRVRVRSSIGLHGSLLIETLHFDVGIGSGGRAGDSLLDLPSLHSWGREPPDEDRRRSQYIPGGQSSRGSILQQKCEE